MNNDGVQLDYNLMYELRTKDCNQAEALKPIADQAVKEIKSTAGWDTEVQINIDSEAWKKNQYSVSISVFGLSEPIVVKKQGRHLIAVFRKARKAALRRLHQLSDQRTISRRRVFFKEQFAF